MAKVADEFLPLSVLGNFPNDWRACTLSDVCTQVTDGTHDSPKPVEVGGYPLITGKAIKGRFIDFDVAYKISEQDHLKVLERSKAERNDILFANIGNSIGDLVRIETDVEFSIKNLALFKPDSKKIAPRFLEYYFLSDMVQGYIRGSTRGSAQPFIGLGTLRGFPVALPPLEEQIQISNLLGCLDDRIALLRETNATLEAMAQAFFKSWFVDFDPVHANTGTRAATLPPELQALFPATFTASPQGLVPEGWGIGTIADFADLNSESWTAKKHPQTVAYIDLANAKDNVIADIAEFEFDDAPSRARRVLRDGDTIVGTVRPGNRSFAFIHDAADNLTGSTGFAVLRPKHQRNTAFIYLAATNDNSIDHLAHVADGGAYPAVRPEVVANLSCTCPPLEVLEAFNFVAAELLVNVAKNHQQAQTLATLRDTLLPRLISGQLRLPDAEAVLVEVGA